VRCGDVDRDVGLTDPDVRLASTRATRADFDGLRARCLDVVLERIREPFEEVAFPAFAFKRIGLARLIAFFAAFGFAFTFVTISAATYTVNACLKSRRRCGTQVAIYDSAIVA
jgi:hypothetical protein